MHQLSTFGNLLIRTVQYLLTLIDIFDYKNVEHIKKCYSTKQRSRSRIMKSALHINHFYNCRGQRCFSKHKPHASHRKAEKCYFFCPWWPWPLTFDLDIQTHPSEGPNTSSLWIWRKCVQRFPRYFIHKQTVTDSATTEHCAVHCVQ